MTELREPRKVLDRAMGQPVAVLKNARVVAYLIPAEAVGRTEHRRATRKEVMECRARTRERVQPALDYLRDT